MSGTEPLAPSTTLQVRGLHTNLDRPYFYQPRSSLTNTVVPAARIKSSLSRQYYMYALVLVHPDVLRPFDTAANEGTQEDVLRVPCSQAHLP